MTSSSNDDGKGRSEFERNEEGSRKAPSLFARRQQQQQQHQQLLLVPPAPLPASRMRNDALSTGCSNLDRILRGGVKTKSMTEFVGENGSGKTQLCLQLLLETVASGGRRRFGGEEEDGDGEDGDGEDEEEEEDANEGFSAVYVTTEGQFPVERLREMWRERRKIQRRRHREKEKSRNIDVRSDAREEDAERRRRREEEEEEEEEEERREDVEDEKRALDSIYVFQAMGNAENCWEVLRSISTVLSSTESSNSDSINRRGKKKKRKKKERNGGEMVEDDDDDETEIRRKPVKLIVIDSLTAPFREDLEEGDVGKSEKHRNMQRVILRAQFLYRFTHLLKEFAWKHNLAVVVTNHVVDSFDDDDDDNYNIRNNINAPPRKQENNSGAFRASNDDYLRERAKGEEKDALGEEETDCYGKRAFPKRFYTSNRFVKPGLGLAWANCPNSSIFLTRDDDDADADGGGGGGGFGRAEGDNNSLRRRRRRRWADAFRSPFAEAQSCAFRIETEGIVDDEVDE